MASHYDWLHRNHKDLYDQAKQTTDYLSVSANRVRMGLESDSSSGKWIDNEFRPKYDAFVSVFTDWKNPAERTPTKITKLFSAEEDFKIVYRKLYTGFLKNSPLVTNDDLQQMGLPLRHSSYRLSTAASNAPDVHVDTSLPAYVSFYFYNKKSNHRRAKPKGQHGVEMAWIISDTRPSKMEDFVNMNFNTHSPFTLSFDYDQRGKTLYYVFRWVNMRGEKGPWSVIASVIIP
jgi:hypothetical protein